MTKLLDVQGSAEAIVLMSSAADQMVQLMKDHPLPKISLAGTAAVATAHELLEAAATQLHVAGALLRLASTQVHIEGDPR